MSTGMPRPLSTTVTDSSACTVTLISSAKPAIASSTELSTTSQTRWCKPISPVEPMYIAGRKRTASSPPRTLMDFASYLWPPCGVTATFSLSPMCSPPRAISSREPAALHRPRAIRSEHPRSKKPFGVKQGRRICGLIRASPYPLIPVSPGESRTRRVPAPSHLAQRDVAKTHVSPGEGPQASGAKPDFWVTFTWPTCRFEGIWNRIDNAWIVPDSRLYLKQFKLENTCLNCLFPLVYRFIFEADISLISLVFGVLIERATRHFSVVEKRS